MSDTATAPVGQTTLDQFVALKDRKADLERQLRTIKDELTPLEQQLLDEFAAEGVAGKRHAATGKLVSITRRIWARAHDGDKPAACAALQAAGLGDYVEQSFNTNSLSAYFRELAAQQESAGTPVADLQQLLPEQLRDAIDLTQDHTLSVRS